MASSGINQSCAITNNSGKSIVVVDAYNSATNVTANSPSQGYGQGLKILSLQGGGTTIANGQTGTVTLDDTRTDSQGKQQPNYLYQLLLSDPQSLFPVMDAGAALDFGADPMGYPPITVTEAAAKNMTLALSFWQQVMAYPSSNLATGFQSAMTAAQGKSTVSAMDQAIVDYFNTTKGYKGLDFPSYLAVTTHLKAFAWNWGLGDDGKTPGRTYWVYSSAGAGQQPSGQGNAAPNLGSIVFALKSDAPNPADPTDPNSGYSITYLPDGASAKSLTFSSGQVVDDASSDLPAICLQGTYALKSQFTGNSDDNVLWPILVGTVNGTKVIAVSQSPETWWQRNISSKTFDDWVDLFLKVTGVWMAYEFLKEKFAGKKNKLEDDKTNENKGQDPTQEQVDGANTDADAVGQASLQQERATGSRLGSDDLTVPDEADLESLLAEIKSGLVDVANEFQGDFYDNMIDEYGEQLKQLAEIGTNDQIEDAYGKLVEAKQGMAQARETGDYGSIKSTLGEVKTNIGSAMENMDISEEVRESIQKSQEAIEEYEESADNMKDVADDISNGEDPVEPIEI